jgi:type VI secretion system protein ImpH
MKKTEKEIKSKLEKLIKTIRTLPIDAKVEIILADLDDELYEQSMVVPIGLFHRNYHKDIDVAEESEFENHLLQLKINRESLYDSLPEGLFHQPIRHKKGEKTKEEILQEIREQKDREKATRKFFLPIEQELYRSRIAIELEEKKYFINPRNIKEHRVFQDFWDIPDFLDYRQICNMVYLLPIAHQIVGNFALTELCFESILQDPIAIKNSYPLSYEIPTPLNEESGQEEEMGIALGDVSLGEDFVLNAHFYKETIPSILINIGPIEANEVKLYAKSTVKNAPNGEKREVLEYLINNFFPYDADANINIIINEPEGYFCRMSDDTEASDVVLGMNSRL